MPYKDPEQQRKYARLWMRERRAAFFCDKRCGVCGSADNLELDHIDPALKVDHKIWSWAEARRAEELKKCQVLCRPCHRAKTTAQTVARHGTLTRAIKKKCRCPACDAYRDRFNTARRGTR